MNNNESLFFPFSLFFSFLDLCVAKKDSYTENNNKTYWGLDLKYFLLFALQGCTDSEKKCANVHRVQTFQSMLDFPQCKTRRDESAYMWA